LESMYNFTELAVQLNEPEAGVAPTDSRLRPDQRLMEEGKWEEANKEKLRLEDKQRTARRLREQQQQSSASGGGGASGGKPSHQTYSSIDDDESSNGNSTMSSEIHEPIWFKKSVDPHTNLPIHIYKNEYWDCKEKQDWKKCPDIF
jgi:oxysterol-binding protein 1